MLEDIVFALGHQLAVAFLDLHGIEFEHLARFQIDEAMRTVFEVEVQLLGAVIHVEEDHLVLIIFKVFQGLEQLVGIVEIVEHVGEDHHEAALVGHLGDLVKALDGGGRSFLVLVVAIDELLQFSVDQLVVHGRHLGRLMEGDLFVEEVQSDGIALAAHQLHERGSGIHAEKQLVGMFKVDLVAHGKAHAGALVDDQLAAEVGLFLVAFHEELLGAAVEFPVDMTNRLARVVEPVFGKLHGKPMERAFVEAGDEAFHDLPCQKLEAPELGEPIPIDAKVQL